MLPYEVDMILLDIIEKVDTLRNADANIIFHWVKLHVRINPNTIVNSLEKEAEREYTRTNILKFTRFRSIAQVLKDEGYITDLRVTALENNKSELEIVLKYFEGKPVIATLKRFSRSGLRQYRGKSELPKVMNGLGISIISTSKGIMTDAQARQLGVGGEVLCFVA